MASRDDFFNLYRHGFARMAVATPLVRIGDPRHNVDATLELMQQAARDKALLAVFPELGLSAYSCEDLFHQRALLDAAESALAQLLARTRSLPLAALVGQDAAFGTNLLFRLAEMPGFVLHVEICEDLWVPAPPSSFAALAGATVFGNLSASNIIIGKE